MYSADSVEMPTISEFNDDVQACITAKRLAGMIRILKEKIINEMNICQEINSKNCQLEINIHQFEERLKELNILCANCETSNAKIERQKKRYSEQLTKISKLISEQNFDAVNWAIILDEMVFANRELFEILFSTAIAERRALQMETIKEEKYRNIAEKLVLKRIELRQELYSQMNNYESLRAQINQTESNLTNLQKSIDVYDAEYWQLNDARHDLQMEIFQLQELFRQRRYCFHSFSKSSFSHTDKDDKDRNTNDKCLTEGQKKSDAIIPDYKISKKTDRSIANAKFKDQSISKIISKVKHDARDNATIKKGKEVEKNAIEVAAQSEVNDKPEYKTFPSLGKLPGMKLPKKEMAVIGDTSSSSSSSNIRSTFMWNKKTESAKNQSIPTSSSVSSNESSFFVESHKLPLDSKLTKKNLNGSTSMESFRTTTPSQTLANETQKEKNAEEMKKVIVDEIDPEQESETDLQSSNGESIIDSNKLSTPTNSDDDTTNLISDSISFSDKSSNSLNITPSINTDIEDQEKKSSSLSNTSSEQEVGIRQPYYISGYQNSSEISTDDNTNSKIRKKSDREVKFPELGLQQQQQQQLISQSRYNRLLHQVESDEQESESLPLQNQNVELWQEISERTFLRDIANRF
ncbi:Keratin, type I cytoskeletal [Dirofilaria immitis]